MAPTRPPNAMSTPLTGWPAASPTTSGTPAASAPRPIPAHGTGPPPRRATSVSQPGIRIMAIPPLTDLEQLEAERSDLGEQTEERRLIGQLPGEHGLGSLRLRAQVRERAELGLAQQPADADLVIHGFCG